MTEGAGRAAATGAVAAGRGNKPLTKTHNRVALPQATRFFCLWGLGFPWPIICLPLLIRYNERGLLGSLDYTIEQGTLYRKETGGNVGPMPRQQQ